MEGNGEYYKGNVLGKNMCNNENLVKARSESKMRAAYKKRKVNFIPTENSLRRMRKITSLAAQNLYLWEL